MSENRSWVRFLPGLLHRRLDKRPGLQKIISNTTWLILEKLVHGTVGLLVMITIGRYLGPEGFGLFNYALSVVMIFATLASLGLDGIVVRELVKRPERRDDILGSAFRMKLLAGLGALLALGVAALLIHGGEARLRTLILIVASGTVFRAFDVFDFWFQSRVQAKFSVFARGLAFLLLSGIKIVLVIAGAPLEAFAWATAADVALAGAGLAVAFLGRERRLPLRNWNTAVARDLLRDSWPLILSGLIIIVFQKIDQLILGHMKGFFDLGVYASAQKLIETWNFLPIIILSSLYPAMVRFKMESDARLNGFVRNILALFYFMNIAAALFLLVFSGGFMRILFGGRFDGAAQPLVILSLGSVFLFSSAVRAQMFLLHNLTIYHTYDGLIGIAVLVGLNLVLIPRWGATGAAAANAASAMVSGYLTSFIFRPTRFIGRLQSGAFVFKVEPHAPRP